MALISEQTERQSKWSSSRLSTYLLTFVALALAVLGYLGVSQFNSIEQVNTSVRIERAGRAAVSIVGIHFDGVVSEDSEGAPTAITLSQDQLQPDPLWNTTLDNIGNINEGAANIFRYSPETNAFDRVATTFRTADGERVGGSQVEPGLIAAGHPAFEPILASTTYVGEVPVAGQQRFAYLTPVLDSNGSVIGILAVDVGLVEDLQNAAVRQRGIIIAIGIGALALMTLAAVSLMYWSFRPLVRLGEIAHALGSKEGVDEDAQELATRDDEIGYLAKGLNKVADLQNTLEHQAFHDTLTRIPNRAALLREIDSRFEELDRTGHQAGSFALLIIDLDGFKNVNDGLGHQAGDELLVAVTTAVKSTLQENEFLARLGGDEFAVISASDAKISESVSELADRILDKASSVFPTHAGEARVTASIGIAIAPEDATTSKEAIAHADLALYEAKRTERGTAKVYEASLSALFQRQIYLGPELKKALDGDGLEIVYQPLYSPEGELRSVEALSRWNHEIEGTISPAEFIPLAEGSGLIYQLGEMVLETVGRDMTTWAKLYNEIPVASVNVSTIQLRHIDFIPYMTRLLERYPALQGHLSLELTESVMVSSDSGWHRPVLERLANLGVKISIDDFGTGYSSLSYLHELAVDQVKVDGSFIKATDSHPDSIELLGGIIALGKGLGLDVVVEGVETKRHLDILNAFEYDYLQGYLLAKPMSAKHVVETFDRTHPLMAAPQGEFASQDPFINQPS